MESLIRYETYWETPICPKVSQNMKWNASVFTFYVFFPRFFWRNSPRWARASSFTKFLDHTRRRTTIGSTPLDEWSASRRDLYMTTHDTHTRQTSMPPVVFEPTISAGERPQTYALDRAAIGTGWSFFTCVKLYGKKAKNSVDMVLDFWLRDRMSWKVFLFFFSHQFCPYWMLLLCFADFNMVLNYYCIWYSITTQFSKRH